MPISQRVGWQVALGILLHAVTANALTDSDYAASATAPKDSSQSPCYDDACTSEDVYETSFIQLSTELNNEVQLSAVAKQEHKAHSRQNPLSWPVDFILHPPHDKDQKFMPDHLTSIGRVYFAKGFLSIGQCPLGAIMKPMLLAVVFTLGALFVILYYKTDDRAETSNILLCLAQLVTMVSFTMPIPDSWTLGMELGMPSGGSGEIVGFYMLGAALGTLVLWASLRRWPKVWCNWPRLILFTAVGCIACYAWLYLVAIAGLYDSGNMPIIPAHCLLLARLIGGIGQGFVWQLAMVNMVKTTKKADLPQAVIRFSCTTALAIGIGPCLAGVQNLLVSEAVPGPSCDIGNHFELVPMFQMVLVLGCVCVIGLLFPDMTKFAAEETQITAITPSEQFQRVSAMLGAVLVNVLRSALVDGVEVGTALVLERDYGKSRTFVGIGVGLTFCTMAIWYQGLALFKDPVPLHWQFRFFASGALLGSVCLFRVICALIPDGFMLLLADAIIFPTAFLAESVSYTIMMQNVFPDGSMLDVNNLSLACNFLGGVFGRFGGPWFARFVLESQPAKGQDRYALTLCLICFASFLVFEAIVKRGLQAAAKDSAVLKRPAEPSEVSSSSCSMGEPPVGHKAS